MNDFPKHRRRSISLPDEGTKEFFAAQSNISRSVYILIRMFCEKHPDKIPDLYLEYQDAFEASFFQNQKKGAPQEK